MKMFDPFQRYFEKPLLFWNAVRLVKEKKDRPSIEALIECILVHVLAKQRKLSVSDIELQRAANWFRSALGLKTAADTFAFLKDEGLDVADLESMLETQLLYHKLRLSICSADSVQNVFASNLRMFEVVELACLSFDAEDEAEAFYQRLGKDRARFPEPAENSSDGLSGKPCSIYKGLVSRTDLDPEIAVRVFADDAGEFVGPMEIESRFWIYHILLPKRVALDETVYGVCEELLLHDFLKEMKAELFGSLFDGFADPVPEGGNVE